jgi:division protein CdvB (Snf7/Vps24/ESCRT-III family)
MTALTNDELKELAHWFHDELLPHRMYQQWIRLLEYNLQLRDRQIRNQEEGSTAWKRGYAASLQQIIESPKQLITEFIEGDTTETPSIDEE